MTQLPKSTIEDPELKALMGEEGFRDLLFNITSLRQDLLKQNTSSRDISKECGYPGRNSIEVKDLRDRYLRDPISNRIVSFIAKDSWKVSPEVYEEEDSETVTAFEEAWDKLGSSVRGKSWSNQEQGSPIWEALARLDELAGIGQYGIMLLGVSDGQADLKQPIPGTLLDSTAVSDMSDLLQGEEKYSQRMEGLELKYVKVFDEAQVQIITYEQNPIHRRYGLPVIYQIDFNDEVYQRQTGLPTTTIQVHWSRVIHFADNLTSSEVFGIPRLHVLYNRMLDSDKLYGGSAEMFWKGAFPGLSIEVLPQISQTNFTMSNDDKLAMRDQMDKYQNGLQRYLTLLGMTAKSLAPQIADPTPNVKLLLEAVCIYLGVPMRIFMGSERGELASSQDRNYHNETLDGRRNRVLTPRMIIPFVDRCISIGLLPEPAESYKVKWPETAKLTPVEEADLAVKKTQAMASWKSSGLDSVITFIDFLTRILGFTDEEAKTINEAALEQVAEEEAQAAEALAAEAKMKKQLGLPLETPPGGKLQSGSTQAPPKAKGVQQ